MPKNNFQHTTYISENNMGKILNFVISIFEIKKTAKSSAIEKIQILLAKEGSRMERLLSSSLNGNYTT